MTTLAAEIEGDLADKPKRWRDTVVALEQEACGEVIPAEEVFAWLDGWGEEGGGAIENRLPIRVVRP